MLYGVCWVCGETFEATGPDGIMRHVIAFHPQDPKVQEIMRVLATMPLPEPSR